MNRIRVAGLEIELEDGIDIEIEGSRLKIRSAKPFTAIPVSAPLSDPLRAWPYRQIEVWPQSQPYVGDIVGIMTTTSTSSAPNGTYTVWNSDQAMAYSYTFDGLWRPSN